MLWIASRRHHAISRKTSPRFPIGTDRRPLTLDRTGARRLATLAIAQMAGWGTTGMLAVVAREVSRDLGLDLPLVFAGNTIFYIASGLWAPVLAPVFIRYGARPVMVAGSVVAGIGFVVLGVSSGAASFFAAWALLGTAAACMLSTASNILLNQIDGTRAKTSIGAVMLMTGLAYTFFWPATAFLDTAIGWRGAAFVYALVMLAICAPLYRFGFPKKATVPQARDAGSAPACAPVPRRTFLLLAATIGCNAFVGFGYGAVFIELLRAEGMNDATAIAAASCLGVFQTGARAINLYDGARRDGISTAIFAGTLLPLAMALPLVFPGAPLALYVFIFVYGLGSGALAVARATIPLVFYQRDDFVRVSSQIALPINIISAFSPAIFAALLFRFGGPGILLLGAGCSIAALSGALLLARQRPGPRAEATHTHSPLCAPLPASSKSEPMAMTDHRDEPPA